jgi:hypothetical protein
MSTQFFAKSHQLHIGDIVTETGLTGDHPERNVVITGADYDEITYQGAQMPVYFVTGLDTRNKQVVKWTKNGWHRWYTTRVLSPELATSAA